MAFTDHALPDGRTSVFADVQVSDYYDKHNSLHARHLTGGQENPRSHSAKGDASTDDTAAFLKAINNLKARGGSTIYIPAGHYIVDGDQILTALNATTGWQFIGDGWASTILQAKTGTSCAFGSTGGQRLHFQGITFRGTGIAGTENGFRVIGNAQAFLFTACRFTASAIGCWLDYTGLSNQNDKHTFVACIADGNAVGLKILASNSQCQLWLGGSFDNNTVSVYLGTGWFHQIGGMVQHSGGVGTAYQVGDGLGNAPGMLILENVITESEAISIDIQNMVTPGQIYLRHCYLQGLTNTIKATGSPKIDSAYTTFNGGDFAGGAGSVVWYSRGDNIAGLNGATGTYTPGALTIRYKELGSQRIVSVGGDDKLIENAAGYTDMKAIPEPNSPAANYIRFFGLNATGRLATKDSAGVVLGVDYPASSPYTQTYATADRTHANPTSSVLTGISSSTTGSALNEPGGGYVQAEHQQNYRRLQDQVNNLRADVLDLKQLANSIIDDLQAASILG